MRCGKTSRLISPYLDEELNSELRKRVEEHLDTCTGCRALAEELSRLKRMIAGQGREEVRPFFWERLKPSLGTGLLQAVEISAELALGKLAGAFGLAAAVLMLLLFSGMWPSVETVTLSQY